MILHLFLTLILLTFALPILTSGSHDGDGLEISAFDLPVLSPVSFIDMMRQKTQSLCDGKMSVDSSSDKIPHHLWIAVKDNSSSYLDWENIQREIALNPTWSVHICDNEAKDSFIETFFPNTSLLWSYNNINPVIAGASKADIWRYAMLYVFGGVYIDADSELKKPLSEVIKPADQMILACENNYFDGDWCYSPNSEFATVKVIKKNPRVEKMGIFKGRVLTNWCMMSAPNHVFLSSALNTFVKLSKLEYTRLSGLKVSMWDPFSKYVYCTTGPTMFTVSARMVVIANSLGGNGTGNHDHKLVRRPHSNADSPTAGSSNVTVDSYKLASKDFGHEGGVFKAIRLTKNDKNHYTNIVAQKGQPMPSFLVKYAPIEESVKAIKQYSIDMEGSLLKGRSSKGVFLLEKGSIRPINDMKVMEAFNFTLEQVVHVSDFVMSTIPVGPPLLETPL